MQNNILVLRLDSMFIHGFPDKVVSFIDSRRDLKIFSVLSPN